MTYAAPDSGAAGDDLTVTNNATVQDTTAALTLNAGDGVDIQTGTTINAATTLTINGDTGGGIDLAGSTINISGTVVGQTMQILGNVNDDVLQIVESAGNPLPNFNGDATGLGADPGHTNAAFSNNITHGVIPAARSSVGTHFEARGGSDSLELTVSLAAYTVSYFSDTNEANSGVINVGGQFTMSYDGLAPQTFTSLSGGTLVVDATSTPATTTLNISDDATPSDGVNVITGDGGFETTTFSGYANLILRGGAGAETISLMGLDGGDPDGGGGAQPIVSVLLDGDNSLGAGAAGDDTAADIVNVQILPATVTATINTGAGNDAINVSSDAPANTGSLDGILGRLTINAEDHDAATRPVRDGGTTQPTQPYDNTSSLVEAPATNQPTGDTLNVSDDSQNTDKQYAVNSNTVSRSDRTVSPPALEMWLTYQNVELLSLTAGNGSDRIGADLTQGALPTVVTFDGGDPAIVTGSTAVPVPATDQFIVRGSVGDDRITVGDLTTDPNTRSPFEVANIECLHLLGGDGDDHIVNNTQTAIHPTNPAITGVPSVIEGQAGDDVLVGANSTDVIFGGAGVDALFGRGGDDFLFSDIDIDGAESAENGDLLDGGDEVTATPGDSAAQVGMDFVRNVETLVDAGAVKDAFTWLRAQILPRTGVDRLRELACQSLERVGCNCSDSVDDAFVAVPAPAPVLPVSGAEPEGGPAAPVYQNLQDPVDVNADGHLTPLDAAVVINDLNAHGPREITPTNNGNAQPGEGEPAVVPFYYDVNGDNTITPADAVTVINALNLKFRLRASGAEGESQKSEDVSPECGSLAANSVPMRSAGRGVGRLPMPRDNAVLRLIRDPNAQKALSATFHPIWVSAPLSRTAADATSASKSDSARNASVRAAAASRNQVFKTVGARSLRSSLNFGQGPSEEGLRTDLDEELLSLLAEESVSRGGSNVTGTERLRNPIALSGLKLR